MKKNLRKIPTEILNRINNINSDEIVVGCAIRFSASTISVGKLKHLGIEITKEGLKIPLAILPPAKQGRYSSYNVEGEVLIRKDLPKETYNITIEAPNWGDWSNGSHSVDIPRERYQRQFRPPKELEISVKCNDIRPNLQEYIIGFRVEEILSKSAKGFKRELFKNLNLLQENVGACGVQPADISITEYAKSLYVSWEILPPGTRDEAVNRLFRGRAATQEEREVACERYDFFMSLKPINLVYGSSGFRRYFGAMLHEKLVVFENIQYGNAIYILYNNWEELSKKSRLDLLSGKFGTDFDRIIHSKGWKSELRQVVAVKKKLLEKTNS